MINKLIGEVKGIFNIITIIELIISLFYIIIGLILFSNPTTSNVIVSILCGLLLISNGASSIFSYIKRSTIDLFNNNLIYGIILMLIGFISIFVGKILSIFIGIYLIMRGIQNANYGFFLKKFNESSWLITLSIGIFYILIAIISFFTDGNSLVSVVGICILGYGIMNFINIILLRRRSKYFIA